MEIEASASSGYSVPFRPPRIGAIPHRFSKSDFPAEKELPDWRQIEIGYNGANKERATAYLLLPRNGRPPYQVIHFIPGIAFGGMPLVNSAGFRLAPHIRAGRAVFLVSLRGFSGRPWPADRREPAFSSVQYRDQVVQWANDMRRGTKRNLRSPDVEEFG